MNISEQVSECLVNKYFLSIILDTCSLLPTANILTSCSCLVLLRSAPASVQTAACSGGVAWEADRRAMGLWRFRSFSVQRRSFSTINCANLFSGWCGDGRFGVGRPAKADDARGGDCSCRGRSVAPRAAPRADAAMVGAKLNALRIGCSRLNGHDEL